MNDQNDQSSKITFGSYNKPNKFMLKKNQLKRKTSEEIASLFADQTNPSNIILCSQTLEERNQALTQIRDDLLQQIGYQRMDLRKVAFEINDSTKDRLKMKQQIIMHKGSRPTLEEMSELANLYTYLEHQNILTSRNQQDLKERLTWSEQKLSDSRKAVEFREDSSFLDQQFQKLRSQCEQEEKIRNELLRERDAKRSHYASIAEEIDQCRVEYEVVEQKIRDAERQMIQLMSYFDERSRQDAMQLQILREKADGLQRQLLRGQEIWNYNSNKKMSLEIMYVENMPLNRR